MAAIAATNTKQLCAADFWLWLKYSKKGDKFAYHIGDLAHDRVFNKTVDALGDATWEAAGMEYLPFPLVKQKEGCWKQSMHKAFVTLVQRRLSDPLGFEYIAIKR